MKKNRPAVILTCLCVEKDKNKIIETIKTINDNRIRKAVGHSRKDKTKMYDLDIHAYNFIPDDSHKEDDQIYLELVKNAANKKKVVDNITTPKNEKEAKELLKQQEEANKK